MELFEGGKMNKNHRVTPDEAELKLRDKYPETEEYWLTKKQVKIEIILQGLGLDQVAVPECWP